MSAQVIAMQPRPSRLADHIAIVKNGLRSFVEVGKALRAIRDEREYDAAFGTFETFCRAEFGMARRTADQLIAASEVVDNLSAMALKLSTPANERVIRPLIKLEPDDQRKVWSEATERWNKPTAAQVTEVIGEMFPKPALPAAPITDPSGPTERLVLVLDDLEAAAKALSNCMALARVEKLHELLGQRLEKLRAALRAEAERSRS